MMRTTDNPAPTRPQANVTGRLWLERALHGLAVAALICAFWLMLTLPHTRLQSAEATVASLPDILPELTYRPLERVSIEVEGQPSVSSRAWLAALQNTGTQVTWKFAAQARWAPLGVAVEPLADPHHPVRIWSAMPADASVEIAESIATQIDDAAHRAPAGEALTLEPIGRDGHSGGAGHTGAAVVSRSALGRNAISVMGQGGAASATLRDTLTLQPVLLLGQASWESRFVTAALEQHGWQVDARVSLAPQQVLGHEARARGDQRGELDARSQSGRGNDAGSGGQRGGDGAAARGPGRAVSGGRDGAMRPGSAGDRPTNPTHEGRPAQGIDGRSQLNVIDTNRYAAVIVTDDTANTYAAAIETFVRSGGGLVVLGQASRAAGLQGLLPAATLGLARDGRGFEPEDHASEQNPLTASSAARDRLQLLPLERLRQDTHVLEKQGEAAAVAIRRVEKGRVLQSGYIDSWRWNMAAPDPDAPQAYREWVAQLLSIVAYAPREDLQPTLSQLVWHDPAPQAAWHAAFGAPAILPGEESLKTPLLPVITLSPSIIWLATAFAVASLAMLMLWLSRRLRGAI